MTKIDVNKQLEQAESYIHQLDESVTDENALTETLTNLVDVLKPIGAESLNYKILCAAVSEILNFNDACPLDTSTRKKKYSKIGAIVDFFQSLKLNSSYDRKELANSSKDNINEKEADEKTDEKKEESSPKAENPKLQEPEEQKDDLRLEKKKLSVKTLAYLFNCIKNEFDVEDKNASKPQIIITSEPESPKSD
ncbi:hypothetical protein ACKWTF_010869 [Chironomus riparius]